MDEFELSNANLLKEHQSVVENLSLLADDPDGEPAQKKIASDWRGGLEATKIYSEEDFELVFVAEVGRGKSTLVSALSGLHLDISGSPQSWAVLPVGAGRTTVGEVVISRREDPRSILVTVEPIAEEELKAELRLLAADVWAKLRSGDSETVALGAGDELHDILRRWVTAGEDQPPRQALEALCQRSGSQAEFFLEVEQRLPVRPDYHDVQLTIENDPEGLVRLRDTLREINSGGFQLGLAPRSVAIATPTFPSIEGLARIVDTQGLDSGATAMLLDARLDLQRVKHSSDSLVVVASGFASAPDDTARLVLASLAPAVNNRVLNHRPSAIAIVDNRDRAGRSATELAVEAEERIEQCLDRIRREPDLEGKLRNAGLISTIDARFELAKLETLAKDLVEDARGVRRARWEELLSSAKTLFPGIQETEVASESARMDLLFWRTLETEEAAMDSDGRGRLGRDGLFALGIVLDVSSRHWTQINASVRRRGRYRKLDLAVLGASAVSFFATRGMRQALEALDSHIDHVANRDASMAKHLELRREAYASALSREREWINLEWTSELARYFESSESDALWDWCSARWGQGEGYVAAVRKRLEEESNRAQLRIGAVPQSCRISLPSRPALFRLRTLTVSNFRGIASSEVSLGEVTLLVGDNGEGKTTWLDVAAAILEPILEPLVGDAHGRVGAQEDIRRVHERSGGVMQTSSSLPLEIVARGTIEGRAIEWSRRQEKAQGPAQAGDSGGATLLSSRLRDDAVVEKNCNLPVFAYYRTDRLWESEGLVSSDLSETDVLYGYSGCLNSGASFARVVSWLRKYTYAQVQEKREIPQLSAIRAAVLKLVDGAVDFFYSIKDELPYLVDAEGVVRRLDTLSDGYRNIVALAADLAWRAVVLNPHLYAAAPELAEGVVMVDELDLHLHPRWQRRVLHDLHAAFPRIQFVVTTHSPFVVQSANPEWVVNLDPELRSWPSGSTSPEDIVEQVMGVEMPQRSSRRQELAQVAEEYYSILEEVGGDPSGVRRLKNRLDELEYPYAEDVAFVTFLRHKRRKAGL